MAIDGNWDRRSVLRAAAKMAGAAAAAPLLGASAMAQADPSSNADALFKAGEFEQAGRAYEEILKQDFKNVHAARQRGYVGLLANKFADAEKHLEMAITLAPDDTEANRFLADCYTRQDKFSLTAPRYRPSRIMYFGVLDSFKLGGIERRDIPVSWSDEADEPNQM